MGSMGGHVLQAIIFVALGTWHLSAFFAAYLKAPRDYIAHAWYPVSGFSGRLKHLELYLLLLFLPLAIFYDLGISMQFQPLFNGAMPWSSIVGFEHVTILFMFWIFALIVLVSDTTSALPFPPEGSFLFASLAFSLQWMSIQHGADLSSDLERQCYTLLAYTAAVCAVSSGMLDSFQPYQIHISVWGFCSYLPSTLGGLGWRGWRENQSTELADGLIEWGLVVWV